MHQLLILSIGSGGEETLTKALTDAILNARCLLLRTSRHPILSFLQREGLSYETMDGLYENSDDFDALNRAVRQTLVEKLAHSDVCYVVPDFSEDSALEGLIHNEDYPFQTQILSGVSHRERCLSIVGAVGSDIRSCSGSSFPGSRLNPEQNLLLTEIFTRECAGECKLALMDLFPEETPVSLITGDEETGILRAKTIPLYEMDRQKHYNHLTSFYLRGIPCLKRERSDMDDLNAIVRILRSPEGCPWDREQTHESILSNLLEESWEYIQAVKDGDTEKMYDELGDVLFQVAIQSEMARQCGEFEFHDVTTAITRKMIDRHTHVFGDVHTASASQVLNNWENFKRCERGLRTTAEAMRDVSSGLSTLLRGRKILNKAIKAGMSAEPSGICQRIREILDGLSQKIARKESLSGELGGLLLRIVCLSLLSGDDPDISLHQATEAFIARFDQTETESANAGLPLDGIPFEQIMPSSSDGLTE